MSHIREFEHLKITLEAIKSATNNFCLENWIGRGGFGNVYKGEIVHSKGQSMVAFKRLDRAFGQGNPEFWKEITMLSLYKHENLVHLLGFCDESDEKILVYDYASNRSLDFHLNSNALTWTQRLKICIGMARGLAYLHNSVVDTHVRVLHRDIKSSNILLDENWNAKISDFGLSKFAKASKFTFLFTSAVGTLGYCDPLYAETGFLTKESDVYSFGVVLFEVLCGRLCICKNDDRPLTGLARGISAARNEKRSDCEDLSDGGTPYSYNKKSKVAGSSSGNGGEYRKDREEWSDTAIAFLLDAYLEKFMQLNRGNLRVRDWEEVAAVVSERCENQSKSVEQCKNKVDNLKKRYKLERHRVMNNNGGNTTSHWPWYQKMEQIVGNSLPLKPALDEDKSVGGINSSARQSKRYTTATSSPNNHQITNMEPKSVTNPRWRRVVFKISGSAFTGTDSQNIDPKVVMLIAREVSIACHIGIEVAIVVGGRNFFCGDTWVTSNGLDRTTAYQIGMMATVMNSILLQSTLEKLGVVTRVQSSFCMPEVSEPYNKQRAIRHLEKGRVVIFGGIGAGTGNPLFSTDTAAALRASEIHADVVIKGSSLHGIYDCAIGESEYEHISFREFASRGVALMDMMAVTFCQENGIPVVMFNLDEVGNISRALCGEHIGMLIDLNGRVG